MIQHQDGMASVQSGHEHSSSASSIEGEQQCAMATELESHSREVINSVLAHAVLPHLVARLGNRV
jgi:hypothetical protein